MDCYCYHVSTLCWPIHVIAQGPVGDGGNRRNLYGPFARESRTRLVVMKKEEGKKIDFVGPIASQSAGTERS